MPLSPMMQHYLQTKQENPDCLLFYRLGDFYEMFYDDAITVSRELELTLTGKECGLPERAPMCGVPYHAVETYLERLVEKGYRIAICEQMEDPKLAKGLVKREVVRIVTPGTLTGEGLEDSRNNYILCAVYGDNRYGLALSDVSTGLFFVSEAPTARDLFSEIDKYSPSEILINDAFSMSDANLSLIRDQKGFSVWTLPAHALEPENEFRMLAHFDTDKDKSGLSAYPLGCEAAGALFRYLQDTQKNDLAQLTRITVYPIGRYMTLDLSTRRNLELIETLREKQKKGSLLWVLDHTGTAMGARMLRSWIEQPLVSKKEIQRRQDAIWELNQDLITREEIREYLRPVYDLERLMTRIAYRTAGPRELIALGKSLSMLPHIRAQLKTQKSALLKELCDEMDPMEDLCALIEEAIAPEPPVTIREGGLIRDGYHEEVDRLRLVRSRGKDWVAQMEEEERNRTGIRNLRIKYNRVFGYYLEVTNSFKELVPEDYIRRQTLANAERYTTPRLKELEEEILGAEDRLNSLEYDLFCEVRDKLAEQVVRVQNTARAVAGLDVLASLAYTAERNRYVRPAINEKGRIDITAGRHPVIELMNRDELFVPNDTLLDQGENRLAIITGPNMAGKSTYMRQVALIVLMAQMGSFVPADAADIGICDRIFTRVGASDDLASGQSTFMVEMNEVANILRNATKNSLLILDEIGRGTSTFDGLSIAWAVVEHIADPRLLGAKTLFATHYHELTELENTLPGVQNYCIAVKEQGEDILFLRKIIPGGADRSYGIQVARLAGVPDSVLKRANEILNELRDADVAAKAKAEVTGQKDARRKEITPDSVELGQMTLFDTANDEQIIEEISGMDLSQMTPIDALNTLYRLQSRICNRWGDTEE